MDEAVIADSQPMANYTSLIIRNFELSRDLYTSAPESRMSERDRLVARMPDDLAGQIERSVLDRHIYQEVSRSAGSSRKSLVLQGRFTQVGRFRVSITASLHDGVTGKEVAHFRQTLWDVFDTSQTLGDLASEVADFITTIQNR